MKSFLTTAAVALALSSAHAVMAADSPAAITGRWDAALTDNGPPIPFRLDISGSGAKLQGTFYDGFHPYDAATSVTFTVTVFLVARSFSVSLPFAASMVVINPARFLNEPLTISSA